ncbi:MAG TPA: GNAT family N-acetyltransferase [Thermoanaerobaculia bacterium]|nr:GNAT family N-acetyltransferase [Thermoanaerobaculia bacterium]
MTTSAATSTASHVLFVFGGQACVPSDPLAAAKRLGFEVSVLAERQPCGLPPELADRVVLTPFAVMESVVARARELHAERPLHAVLGYDDQAVPIVARIAAACGLTGNPTDAADAARDKPMMKERFRAAGVPIADYHLASGEADALAWAERIGYPVVVKPTRGSASQGVIRANSPGELREAYRRVCRIVREYGLDTDGRSASAQLVERYVHGAEYSVELFIRAGRVQPLCVFEKPDPLFGPFFEETVYVTPPRLDAGRIAELEKLAVRAAQAVGLQTGLAHCEIRIGDQGPVVLELAGRLIGGACSRVFRALLPIDVHELILRLAAGEDIARPRVLSRAAGALMLPIPAEGRMIALDGAEAARAVPGIQDVIINSSKGDVILPFPEQSCYIGFITAAGDTFEDVQRALAEASDCMELEMEPLECERLVRALSDESERSIPAGVRTLGGLSVEDARAQLLPLVAAAYHPELPPDDAREQALACVRCVEEGKEGDSNPGLWLIHEGGGFLLASRTGQTGHLLRVGVIPDARGKNIAVALMRAAFVVLAEAGCTEADTLVDPRLPAPGRLARKLGFAPSTEACQTSCCEC